MTPLSELATRLRKVFPEAELDFCEPATTGSVGFLDITRGASSLSVQWQEQWQFGLSSPEGHGYGEKPDEVYRTVEEVATRIIGLLDSGRKTEPPLRASPGAP
jgi:hypothetical protein